MTLVGNQYCVRRQIDDLCAEVQHTKRILLQPQRPEEAHAEADFGSESTGSFGAEVRRQTSEENRTF
jgi:hypothetical protein